MVPTTIANYVQKRLGLGVDCFSTFWILALSVRYSYRRGRLEPVPLGDRRLFRRPAHSLPRARLFCGR